MGTTGADGGEMDSMEEEPTALEGPGQGCWSATGKGRGNSRRWRGLGRGRGCVEATGAGRRPGLGDEWE
ncbi:hypothetical protein PR202_ga25301 [Eleusine coracana subsp. coracana]|uniref:Uncharacterized protein n=1 Tax=Eleusine coracana subsp. coracana TaxID=191504 RepID=A0AAV5D942_ELECO|nr:hypothetical protein PR202_ga25301 [Eleusine coracana subsp. coracana]